MNRKHSRPRKGERGVALLMVLLSIALLSAIVTRYSYEAYIDYQLAQNAADRAQAYYNARSGVEIYKLILSADKQLTGNPQLKAMAESFGINTDAYGLWMMLPELDTRMIRAIADPSIKAEDREAMREMFGGAALDFVSGSAEFLDFHGDFAARIENEDGKINLNKFTDFHTDILDAPVGRAIFAMTLDEQYDSLFEGYNALGERRLSREEVIGNIDDWLDNNTEPILTGGGSEDALYYRYEDQYRARNNRMETLQELALVRGIDDDFMREFSKQLTVWSDGKININTAPREVIAGLFLAYSVVQLNTEAAYEAADAVLEYRALQPFAKPDDFVVFARDVLGVELSAAPPGTGAGTGRGPSGTGGVQGARPTPGQGAAGGNSTTQKQNIMNAIGVQTKVFRITSTGYAGEARTTITAIVDNTQAESLRILYWRVD